MKHRDGEFALQWLEKARHDLLTARLVLEQPDGPTDTPSFHAQQAVEKALKGLLTAAGIRYERTHDLMPLLDESLKRLPQLEKYRELCAQLSEYGVAVRYPGASDDPSRADALEAMEAATEIVDLVERQLATDT